MIDIAITGNRIITPGGITRGTVLISEGKILEVTSHNPGGDFEEFNVGDLLVMPAIVDPHVHINEPGRTDWEGFNTATLSAIAGGVGSMVDMPLNSSPVTTNINAFEQKIRSAKAIENGEGRLHCNVGFWGGIIPGNEKDIEQLAGMGVLGFKAFLTHSGIDDFPNVTEHHLRKAMPIIAALGLPLLVHCELEPGTQKRPDDPSSYNEYLLSRPAAWEDDAIRLMIQLCEEFNCRVHIVHLSSSNSIKQIAEAKQRGLPITVETAQHYLYFHSERIPDGRTEYKCAPPIRDKRNNDLLWKGLIDGIIDYVATDHSPAPPAMKMTGSGDLFSAWGGISSIQFSLPALWTAAKRRGCLPEQMATWLCSKPSILPGLQSTKGKIASGYDADLVVWDPDAVFKVTEDLIQHKHKVTPYLNEELCGVVRQTWLAGKKVYDEGKFLHLNQGQLIFKK